VVDADDLVHRLYLPGSAVCGELVARWGAGILNPDGSVNRNAVAQRVFTDDRELDWLTGLVHPLVDRQLQDLSAACTGRAFYCGVPLLFENGWDTRVTHTVAVWCDGETQRTRLRLRGWTDAEIRARLARQMSMDDKLARAGYGLINTGSLEMLRQQCRLLHAALAA
jgi:dephospho-CoA kinase